MKTIQEEQTVVASAQLKNPNAALIVEPAPTVTTFPLRLKSKFAPPQNQAPAMEDWVDAKDYCQIESYESLKARVEKRERVI